MNKKFSTLVASLLLSSAFSVYAGNAKPMLATPTQVETRATSADVEEAVEVGNVTLPDYSNVYLNDENDPVFAGNNKLGNKVLSGFTNNSRIAYVGAINIGTSDPTDTYYLTVNGAAGTTKVSTTANYNVTYKDDFYWSLVNGKLINNAGRVLTVADYSDNFEVVPVAKNGEQTKYFVIARRDVDGKIQYVRWDISNSKFVFTGKSGDYSDKISEAALFVSVETAFSEPVAGDDLNDELGDGFELFISSSVKDDAEIVNADVFAGKLSVVEVAGVTDDATKYYQIKNAAGKLIVFDSNERITSDGYSRMGKFKLISSTPASGQYSYFKVTKADNDSDDIIVTVLSDETPQQLLYRLYIANAAGTYALTISRENPVAENWAATSLSGDNYADLRQFLTGQYVTVDFVKGLDANKEDDVYKKDGRLAVLYNTIASATENHVDYVPLSSLASDAPEAQWAVSSAYENYDEKAPYFDGSITLTNRENPAESIKIEKNNLRKVRNTVDIYEVVEDIANTNIKAGEQIKIQFVKDVKPSDGYARFTEDELKNTTWYLGQVRKAEATESDLNVYWTENHTAEGTHQIGATVDEASATKWNLSIVTKNIEKWSSEQDSVLVISKLNKWNPDKSRVEMTPDTLVIFPYAFQNRSNGEFVEFNDATNLDYYQCREYTTAKESVFNKDNDARFALKKKADGTYNYVVLPVRSASNYNENTGAVNPVTLSADFVGEKVYQFNSADRGTWGNMNMYAKDANSLMFVTPVDAPEYRKLVAENGIDSVTIYRADNDKQVIYEKKDAKASALLERPVSFLNIDNIAQYPEINSSLYVDSAYVNRGNNTRYQYLLGVDVKETRGYYCPLHGFVEGDSHPCTSHAQRVVYKQGRYLMNMIDTANVLAEELKVSIHNNPFINETTEGNTCAKLAFVDAIHVLTDSVDMTKSDTLYVINNADARDKYTAIPLSSDALNTVKFAFKYVDSNVNEDFKIQTLWKEYAPNTKEADRGVSEEGYLRWVNGCVVVDKGYMRGDVFNMNEDETRTPTANEEIATSSVVVAGTNGAVVVKGAEGKNVIVSTILGKVVANEVVSSDNATIAAPAGVVVVSVDGESFKVVVK